jgi:hypothetical protein
MMVGQFFSGAGGRLPIRSFGNGVGGFAIKFIHSEYDEGTTQEAQKKEGKRRGGAAAQAH